MSAKDKEQRKRRHAEIFTLITQAKAQPCARCKQAFPSVCMDFDHLPQYKKDFTIGSPANWTSVSRIQAEIAKTQILCSNCHRILTWERKNGREVDPYAGLPGSEDAGKRQPRQFRLPSLRRCKRLFAKINL